jgi:FixJ family two-component response regulator
MTDSLRGNIYIIEDDPSIRNTLKKILTSSGHQVSVFSSPQLFFSTTILHPAVIILDMILPDTHGTNIQQELMKNNESAPIIFMSGESCPLDKAIFAMKHGAIDFLVKPFDINELLLAIENGLKLDLQNIKQLNQQELLKQKLSVLTNREYQVYELLLKGLNNQEIMDQLEISLPTTKQYKTSVMRKLNVKSFSQLVELHT